jgi:hypothetical protein
MAIGWLSAEADKVRDAIGAGKLIIGWKRRSGNPEGYYSEHGFAEHRVQLDPDGRPAFDRVVIGEAPNINAVVYGYRPNGVLYVGVIIQARPFADKPDRTPADPPIVFAQPCVMGFNLERVAGKDAAIREASEEAGTESAILKIESLGLHNPNPTFCATWSELFAIQVDLDLVEERVDESELIYRAEYLQLAELIRRIGLGEYKGVNYRSATANDALFVWLSRHPNIMQRHI